MAVTLEDRYTLEGGTAFMTGVQALVRLPIEQARRDRAAGLRIGTLISGYPGSPLGGYDLALLQARQHLQPLDIHLRPGLNEELAAAAVWGSQMTEVFGPGTTEFDGVTGIWFGKSPGVDRCLDIFRHANLGGGPRHSGLLALAADDPQAKSSTLPNYSEWDFVACGMPVLNPASVSEVLELGLHGIALSRVTGLWPALKCVTNLCDGGASVRVGPDEPRIVVPELGGFQKPNGFIFFAPGSIELERHLFEERFPAAQAYARANGLDRVVQRGRDDRLGIVTSGKTYADVLQALRDFGLNPTESGDSAGAPNMGEAQLAELGVRVLKLGLIHPVVPETVREFARGLREIVVVEEKRDLIESQLRGILYDLPDRIAIRGKRDAAGRVLFPYHGELDADVVAERLGPILLQLGAGASVSRRLAELEAIRGRGYEVFARRLPNYCPGCPHSRSTVALDGELVGGGIGCHGMAPMMTQAERQTVNAAPMGAEGVAFLGLAPFVSVPHFVQNVGDGTFFHSASQALRACVAGDLNITFKLLFNGHVAMTGGQDPTGAQDVVTLTRYLETEGVKKTIVVSENEADLRGAALAANAVLQPRERYEDAVRELRQVPGVTVLIFDQECAAEKRRARKRGKQPEPQKFVLINEEVCEGCGDCGDVSNCMSVQPVETELGRKTQIHQSSCNKDYSCTRGDCPSFLTVYAASGPVRRTAPEIDVGGVPEPVARVSIPAGGYRVYMPGIGGTGVVTANQVLAYAALLEGRAVHTLDQTGLAQKGGAVLSSLLILDREQDAYASNRVGMGRADLLLALDLIGVVQQVNADRMDPERTVVVADTSLQPTADAIRHVDFQMPGRSALQRAVDRWSRAADSVWVDAGRAVESLFGDQMLTNTFLLGVAYQAGLLPVRAESLEAAMHLNGVAVERNLQAFRYGRLYQHDPAAVRQPGGVARLRYEDVRGQYMKRLGGRAGEYREMLEAAAGAGLPEEPRRMLAMRLGELILYQDAAYARRYLQRVLALYQREQQVVPGQTALTVEALRNLYKLMAYKDEYEVARLLLKEEWAERVRSTFGAAKVRFNLHPPLLRERGLRSKLELGSWFRPALRTLAGLSRLRGTRLDPFGRTEVRRTERELIGWYEGLMAEVAAELTPAGHRTAVQLLAAADRIRGYEEIKMRNVRTVREHVERKRAELAALSEATASA
ncbi:MAG: indolepyruvate ferredoxin oxidoreductase family protein [Candidatus Dormibacteraeota bacterium]|nr:indolepyruvate ferredoxin oxidoreductase family protein [Candidatus Dormibacteraeota bacterium]